MSEKEGQEFTMELAQRNLVAIEEHLDEIIRGEYAKLCIGCLKDHALSIQDKARDCSFKFHCPPDTKYWDKLYKWGEKLRKNIINLGDNDITRELRDEARIFKKAMDGRMSLEKLNDVKLDYEPKMGYIKDDGYIKEV